MALTIAIVVLVLIGLVLAIAASKPKEFTVQRTARIRATPDRIYPHIADYHRWAAWSPYEKLDPAMRKTHTGTPGAQGSTYEWEGNNKVGKGRMELTQVTPPAAIAMKLDFEKPFVAHNTATFALVPAGDGTDVTWAMHGTSPMMMRVMGVFMNMDNLIGKDFEQGLANLKSTVEG